MEIQLGLLAALPVLWAITALLVGNIRLLGLLAAGWSWLHVVVTAAVVAPVVCGVQPRAVLAPGFCFDSVAGWFMLLTATIVACAVTHAHLYFQDERKKGSHVKPRHIKLFYACTALFLVAMTAALLCDNLGFLWISIEATTLLSAPLVYFNRDRHAIEAVWKYLIICSVGIAFALLGTVLIFASSQVDSVPRGTLSLQSLVRLAPQLDYRLFKLGLIFCFLGYGTKAGVFPLHSWLPDAHAEAPAPASAMLSGALLNTALFAIWRLVQVDNACHGQHAFGANLSLWGGTITVVAASLFLVRQHGLKRLWAYSSIENVGIMLVAIGLSCPGLFILQAVNHSFAKTSLFLVSGNIIQGTGSKMLAEIKGVIKLSPVWGILLAFAACAATGVPPFGSFVSEWLILCAGADAGQWLVISLLLAGISLSFIAVSIHVSRILLGTPKGPLECAPSLASNLVPAALMGFLLVLGLTTGGGFMTGVMSMRGAL